MLSAGRQGQDDLTLLQILKCQGEGRWSSFDLVHASGGVLLIIIIMILPQEVSTRFKSLPFALAPGT